MFSGAGAGIVAVIGGIVGLAMVAVLVGQKSQTSSVIQSGGTALSSIISAAVSPVSSAAFGAAASSAVGALA